MTKCYPIVSLRMNLHDDYFCKVKGIHVDVEITYEQFMDIHPKRDLVSCRFYKGKYKVTRVHKNILKGKF